MGYRRLSLKHPTQDADCVGNNAAFTCPVPGCGKVFLVSAHLHRNGRKCPSCERSLGLVKKVDGRYYASIKW
jgi:hypothetical protein